MALTRPGGERIDVSLEDDRMSGTVTLDDGRRLAVRGMLVGGSAGSTGV